MSIFHIYMLQSPLTLLLFPLTPHIFILREKQHTPSCSIYLGQQTHMNSSAHTPSGSFEVLSAVNAISLCRVAVCRMKDH